MIELNISGWAKSAIKVENSSLYYDTTSKNWYLEVYEPDWGDYYYFKSNECFEMLDYIGYTNVEGSYDSLIAQNIEIMKLDEDVECTNRRVG